MAAEELLRMDNVSVCFAGGETHELPAKPFRPLSGINLTVNAGEILLIAGASGAGKSLLARSIVDILPNNALRTGRILYQGQEVDAASAHRLRGRQIAVIPQSLKCLDPLVTVKRHIISAQRKPTTREELDYFMRRLDLPEEVKKMYPSQLSGGMARRVLCIISLITAARVIIADEPTPGLDRRRATALFDIFREYSDRGNGVVLITHDFEFAQYIADRIAIFREGKIVETLSADEVRASGVDSFAHEFSKKLWRARPSQDFMGIFGGASPTSGTRAEKLVQEGEAEA